MIKSNLRISYFNVGVMWFNKLSPYQRNLVRDRYNLNGRTLKITDEMLNDIYQKELKLPNYKRI